MRADPGTRARVADVFRRCNAERRAALIAYLVAGDPSLDETPALLAAAAAGGADIIELGIPYSDPLADGPTIQAAAKRALDGGANFDRVLELMGRAREVLTRVPILAFSYYNPIFVRGVERSAADLAKAGFAGAILPDLPPEEAGPFVAAAQGAELSVAFLVAPTTPPERLPRVAALCTDFVYVVSRMGVTGAQTSPGEAAALIARVRSVTDKPLAIGFGIATVEQVATAAAVAEGVIVGSALLDRLQAASDKPRAAREFLAPLAAACKKT